MPYESIEDAKTGGFPTNADGIPMTLAQINKLAEIYDAVKAAGTAKNPMAVAWTQWKALYEIEDEKWVTRKSKSALVAEAEGETKEFKFDVAILNNKNSVIKVRDSWLYLTNEEQADEQVVRDKLAREFGYDGVGTYYVYDFNTDIKVGDEIPPEIEPIQTVSISVSARSDVFTSKLTQESDWVPVAAIGQQTTLSLKSGSVTLSIAEVALKSNLKSWKGGYINVNHENNAAIDGYKIEDAKFEDGLLHFKVDSKVSTLIRNEATSGRSIEIKPTKIVKNEVIEFTGLGLSVLFPPYVPACSTEMGCSNKGENIIKTTFNKLANIAKSNSYLTDEGNLEHSKDPIKEQTMSEEIDKLVSARIAAESSRDEALKEIETLKSSLGEKDTLYTEGEKLYNEQTELLKSYKEKEAVAAEKLKEDQWDILKSSIPPGKIHKAEDEAALKKEFLEDPSAFAVKMTSFKLEDVRGESGSEFDQKETDEDTKTVMELKGME
ncbi:hypothetical protein KA005_04145 [bacterium]|nr:hypothetical protein [bacterium]